MKSTIKHTFVFLTNKDIESLPAWVKDWKENYHKALTTAGQECLLLDPDKVMSTIESKGGTAYLMLAHYSEYLQALKLKLDRSKVKLVMQVNGTAVNPFIYQLDLKSEEKALKNIDYNLSADKGMTQLIKNVYGIDNVFTTGFPVNENKVIGDRKTIKKKGRYCIGGRLTPDKLVYFSMLLALQRPDCHEIVVCYPEGQEKHLDYYPKREMISYKKCTQEEFLDELAASEYYVIASLGDTLSISTVQAKMLRCSLVHPTYNLQVPFYHKISGAMNMFKPSYCARKVIEAIEIKPLNKDKEAKVISI